MTEPAWVLVCIGTILLHFNPRRAVKKVTMRWDYRRHLRYRLPTMILAWRVDVMQTAAKAPPKALAARRK